MKGIPEKVTRSISRELLKARKNSPHIFFVAGLVGTVGSTILACRATLKLEATIDGIKEDLDGVRENGKAIEEAGGQSVRLLSGEEYTQRDYYKDLSVVYFNAGKSMVRLYGPSVVLGGASVAALTGSHVQLTRRNSALTASLVLISKTYEDYRARVIDAIGEEKELDIYHGIKDVETEVDGKKKILKVGDPNGLSPYARFFDEFSTVWEKDPEINRYYILCQQNYWNQILRHRGHVFLSEVYDSLGLERSQESIIVGWVLSDEGDNYISFNLYEPSNSRFIQGYENSVLLDFNVDGVIFDKI